MRERRCNDKEQTVVEVQGQLRIGKSDFGVNGRRNQRFLLDLSRAVQQPQAEGGIPPGKCVADADAELQQAAADG